MKPYIIIFVIVLIVSCFLNGGGSPYNWKVGIKGVDTQGKMELTKQAGLYPEMRFVDGHRNVGLITEIKDVPMTPESLPGEYPYGANN